MRITHYRPEHPLLIPLIAGIYLLERDLDEPAEQYLAFPGIHHFVTINRSAVNHLSAGCVSVTYRGDSKPSAMLIANFDKPRLWTYEGPAQEWNICFHPLAIHHFLDNGELLSGNGVTELTAFDGLSGHLEALYTLPDPLSQLRAIEDYWASKFKPFQHAFLAVLIGEILENKDNRVNYSEWAARFKISRHTLHAAFKRYVGTTPARFEKIYRFRQALSAYRLAHPSANLTGISGMAAYFDQSHMIRDFRALTGYTPKLFYKKVAAFPKGDINWIFD